MNETNVGQLQRSIYVPGDLGGARGAGGAKTNARGWAMGWAIGCARSWGQGLGPRVGAEGEEGLGVEGRISISTTTVLPAGASKLKSRDAAAATGGLHDSPRRHAAAPTAFHVAAVAEDRDDRAPR